MKRFALGKVPMVVAAAVLGAIIASAPVRPSQATVVEVGFDLFETQPGTEFAGVPFEGVPLDSFDFGVPIGLRNVGTTDTIVRRFGIAEVPVPPGTDTVPIELVALQLKTVSPVDFGAGLDFHFATLQSDRGGPASGGQIDITFADALGGTFDSLLNVFLDLRIGALDGPIVFSFILELLADDVPWDRVPDLDAILIPFVNLQLNGADNTADFFPDIFSEASVGLDEIHIIGPGMKVPEPATLALFAVGLAGLGFMGWRRRRGHQIQAV